MFNLKKKKKGILVRASPEVPNSTFGLFSLMSESEVAQSCPTLQPHGL